MATAEHSGGVLVADRREPESVDPPYLYADYRSTLLRAPSRPAMRVPYGPSETTGPLAESLMVGSRAHAHPADLTAQREGEPIGQRIIAYGRVLDSSGRPMPRALVEIWQANAAGRYVHEVDQHPAPLDPGF
ncbi:MAG TPA: hypothetical protein VGL13_09785, partial [Polyangiaceae bacterium]